MLQKNLFNHFMFRRNVRGFPRLPESYQEVEYLQSTGTQYIDTGIIITDKKWQVEFDSPSSVVAVKLGASTGSSVGYCFVTATGSSSATFGIGSGYQVKPFNALQKNTVYFNEYNGVYSSFSLDGKTYYNINRSTHTYPVFLFARNSAGTPSFGIERVYSSIFKSNVDDAVIQYLTPAIRKTDSVAGMYDTVNGTFTENAGTGSFIAGPYVNAEAWTPAELSPVAWWKLEGNGFNSVGSYDASVSGAIANGGKIGQSYTFSGGTDIIEAPYTGQPAITNVFTLSAWFRTTTNSASAMRIAGLDASYITWIQDGNWWWYGGIHGDLISSENVADGQWHLATVTYSGAGVFCYLDGKYINTIAKTGDVSWSNVGIVIGNRHDLARGFTGDIDDVLIFDKALTPTEITKLYNESVYRGGAAWPA